MLTEGNETRTALALNTSKNWAEQKTPSNTSLRRGDRDAYSAPSTSPCSAISLSPRASGFVLSESGRGVSMRPSMTMEEEDDGDDGGFSLAGGESFVSVGVRLNWAEDIWISSRTGFGMLRSKEMDVIGWSCRI